MHRTLSRALAARGAATITAVALLMANPIGLAASAQTADPEPDQVILDIGNDITAYIHTITGETRLTTPTPLVWDPNLTRTDRFGFGGGWTFGTTFIDMIGELYFYLPGFV